MGNGSETKLEAYARIIRDLGFPATVAGVLLWFLLARLAPSIEVLTQTMHEFKQVMVRQTAAFERATEASVENNERLRQMMGDSPWNKQRREGDK